MKTTGIISEYNPFHNGHLYHLNKSMSLTNSDYCVCVMSGNFLQRGEPAIADKYSRALSACQTGINAVFELPVIFSTGSASDFAFGAVSLLSSMNSIDYLSFGVEASDTSKLIEISDIICSEPSDYKALLKDYQKEGFSFASARAKAISSLFDSSYSDIINSPNNILAIEYLAALKKLDSPIKPIFIQRKTAMYHDEILHNSISSATAIRSGLKRGELIKDDMPETVINTLKTYLTSDLITENDLTSILSYIHAVIKNMPSTDFLDLNSDMKNRFISCPFPAAFTEVCDYMKTKNIAMSRIKRGLIHMLLGISKKSHDLILNDKSFGYANLLSFRKNDSILIKNIKNSSSIPIITKKADFKPIYESSKVSWSYDIRATEIYNQIVYNHFNKALPNELSSNVKIYNI